MKTTHQLYTDIQRRLPRWVMGGLTTSPLPDTGTLYDDGTLYGETLFGASATPTPRIDIVFGTLCIAFEEFYRWFDYLLAQTYIDQSNTEFLDIHAADRGQPRLTGETDQALRKRLRTIPDCVTENAIHETARLTLNIPRPGYYGRATWGRFYYRRPGQDAHIETFTLRDRFMYWGKSHWQHGKRNRWGTSVCSQNENNPFCVAVVIVPRVVKRVNTAWDRYYWQRATWGGRHLDTAKYAHLRENINQRKAAGTTVLIYLRNLGDYITCR